MRKNLLRIGVVLLLAGVVFADSKAMAALVTLSGHVPAAVASLTAESSLPGTNKLTLAVGLPLRNREALSNLLQQVYDPASANYHKYLTPDEFTTQFGPTEQDYQTVIDYLNKSGLVLSGTYSNRMLVDVTGKVSDIQNAFHVTLHKYHHPTEARDFYAPDTEPAVDSSIPVLHISGLDNYYIPHPNFKVESLGQKTQANPAIGSAPGGSYQGKDFRNAYAPGVTLTGTGQNIALLQFDGFYSSDIQAYENQIGLTSVPNLVVVPIDGGVPTPTPFGNPEVSLDIEMVLSMSPGVSNIYVYEAPNPSPWEDILNRMVSDDTAKQISSSWGGGAPDPVSEQIFQQMALQGQTFFNAAGDSDAYTGEIPFPSDSPNIAVVGGTTLTTGPSASYVSETVWNVGPSDDGEGGSGGISTTYNIPIWQTNIDMRLRQGSQVMRDIPDVALTADNVWVIFGGGAEGIFGGTSCASPLWAGFTALINEQAANNGLAPMGFIDPALYALAATSRYTNYFRDVTTGNNTWSGSPNLFFATNGYDLCTGLGTPNGTNLINALTSVGGILTNTITHLSAPPPPYGTTLSVLNGSNPNGNWELFIQYADPFNSGVISNGWSLTVTTANPVGAAADEAVTMATSVGSVDVNGYVDYSITVTNYGPMASTNVIVTDTLPDNSTFVSSAATLGTVDRIGSSLIWTVGTPGTSSDSTPITVLTNTAGAQLTVTVQANGNSPDYLFNTATVTSDTPDPNPADNTASANTTIASSTAPVLAGLVGNNGVFQLSVNGVAGQQYIVEATTNLSTIPVVWVPLYTNTAPFTFPDPNASDYTTRFYQAIPAP